jgi:predicted RNA-binding protein YlxR (DUF448 family)
MKSIPQRMCVVTREKTDKNKLLRIVKDNLGNVSVDVTGKKNGKGAYITKDLEVLETAKKKKVLEKVFEIEDLTSVYEEIYNLIK